MRIGTVPATLAMLLLGAAAIRYASMDDWTGTTITAIAAMLALVTAARSVEPDRGR